MLNTDIKDLNQQFESIVEALALSLQSSESNEAKQTLQLIQTLRQNIQVMLRLDSDIKNNKQQPLAEEEITKIADYAFNLLDEVASHCASKGMQEQMLQLHRLSLPVVSWLKIHNGKIKKLDVVVNAIASYANTIQGNKQLEQLCALIKNVIELTDDAIKQDLEATNPMRPWRILNLNWGIVATRTHNTEIMKSVFDQLIKNIPADAQQFFNEGKQQMDAIAYPEPVRELMNKYAQGFGSDGLLH